MMKVAVIREPKDRQVCNLYTYISWIENTNCFQTKFHFFSTFQIAALMTALNTFSKDKKQRQKEEKRTRAKKHQKMLQKEEIAQKKREKLTRGKLYAGMKNQKKDWILDETWDKSELVELIESFS